MKFHDPVRVLAAKASLPSRGAWIEIGISTVSYASAFVAPLTGSVD